MRVGIKGEPMSAEGTTVDEAFAAFWEKVWRVALDSLSRPYVQCSRSEQAARLFCSKEPGWQKRALARLESPNSQ